LRMSFFDGYIGVKKDFPTVKSGFHPFRKKRKERKVNSQMKKRVQKKAFQTKGNSRAYCEQN